MLCTCPLSSGCFLVERHQLPVPAPWRESEHSCGLENVLPAGARHQHRPILILILALLDRLGQATIIPSPQNVENQQISWSSLFRTPSSSSGYWIFVRGMLHISPCTVALLEAAPLPSAPSSGNSQGIDGQGQGSARLDGRLSQDYRMPVTLWRRLKNGLETPGL